MATNTRSPASTMAPLVFSALPGSPDVTRLVQNRLSRVQQQFPTCSPSTLSDLRIVVDELSTISKTCATVLEDLETQDSETDVATAFKKIEAALDWAKCMFPCQRKLVDRQLTSTVVLQHVQAERSPARHRFLFRAHRNAIGDIGSYEPSVRNVFFNDHLRKQHTVDQFVRAIAAHLEKTQREKDTGIKQATMFTSMSSILEWALHTTKNKWSDNNGDERASLVVFDVGRLRELQGVAIFRIVDVIRFLESQNQVHLIGAQLRDWARNSDEYLAMGKAARHAVVQVIPWTDLMSMPIVNDEFVRTYTLGKYRQWKDERNYEERDTNEVGRMVVRSAAVLAGHEAVNSVMVRQMVALILEPGVSFWGINTGASSNDIVRACEEIFREDVIESLSQTSIT